MNTIATNFEAGFRPTDEQVNYARQYLADTGLDSLLVAVNFPGKQRGIWTEGQTRENVMDGSFPAMWVDRESAMSAFDTGKYGNALFRVYSDGYVHLVDEA